MLKKGICLGSVPGADAAERFANAARFGFDGVEVGPMDEAGRDRVKALSEARGVGVTSVMNAAHWQHPLSDPDPEVRKASLAGLAESIDTAAALGAEVVLVVPAVVKPDVTYEQAWERSVASLKEILPAAAERGVCLAVENVWNKFLLSPVEFAAYVDSFASEHLAAYFDVGNILLYGYPDHWIRTLGRRIRRVHLKGFDTEAKRFTYLREGSVDWPAVVSALEDVGYSGYLTAELPVDKADPLGRLQQISEDLDAIAGMASQ